jgi:hypothetical protein
MYTVADSEMSAAATAAATAASAAAEAKTGGSGNPVDWLADGFEAVLKVGAAESSGRGAMCVGGLSNASCAGAGWTP